MEIEYLTFYNQFKILSFEEQMRLSEEEAIKYWNGTFIRSKARQKAIKKYGFSVPNQAALEAIKRLGRPIVEIGAGTGYWSHLLRQMGIDVIAYDSNRGHWFKDSELWTDIILGDHTNLAKHSDRVLFSSWPLEYLSEAEKVYKGDTLIYIGEDCCDPWNEEMWKVKKEIAIPQWEGYHDRLLILRKKDVRS